MALPTLADLKLYLRIQHAAEDGLLGQLLGRAIAMVETHLGAPVTAGRTFETSSSALASFATVQSARTGNLARSDTVKSVTIRSLTEHPDWVQRIETVVGTAIIDVASELYHRRNPSLASSSDAGGSTTYASESVVTPVGLPPRVVGTLRPIKTMIARWSGA